MVQTNFTISHATAEDTINMTIQPKMDSQPRIESPFTRKGFLASYTSLPGTYHPPPNKPLPQIPSPRYNLFPDTYKTPKRAQTPSSLSSNSPVATAMLLSVSDLSAGEETWDLDSGTVSRPDSCTLPPTPGIHRETQGGEHDEGSDEGQGVFFALKKEGGFVRFWVKVENALLESALEVEGVPIDEASRLRCMARELIVDERQGGAIEHVQLLIGSF